MAGWVGWPGGEGGCGRPGGVWPGGGGCYCHSHDHSSNYLLGIYPFGFLVLILLRLMSLNYQEVVLWGGENRGEECRASV